MTGIAIIDYGVGNLRSVEKAFVSAGHDAIVSSDQQVLRAARRLVLPGVGAFRACMEALRSRGFDHLVRERVREGTPLLGICVGMELLYESSDEFGPSPGLGLLGGNVRQFGGELRVPHVGWNQVRIKMPHPLLEGVQEGAFFYFVHSYYCNAEDTADVIGETEYGAHYASVVARENVCGVQFHPEKSQAAGLKLLGNFARLAAG